MRTPFFRPGLFGTFPGRRSGNQHHPRPLGMTVRRALAWLSAGCVLVLAGCATSTAPATADSGRPGAGSGRAHHRWISDSTTWHDPAYLDDPQLEKRAEANARFLTGLVYELNEQPERALEEFYASAWGDPGNSTLVLEVARQLMRNKEHDKAIDLLKKASAQKNVPGTVFSLLGAAHFQLGHSNDAIAASRKAIQRAPALLASYQTLLQLYLQNRQPAEALKLLDEASRVNSSEAAFWVELAEMYFNYLRVRVGETAAIKPRIVTALNKGRELQPSNPLLLTKLADGYYLMGEMTSAAELYLQLLARPSALPGLPGVREKLTEIYLRTGAREKAATELERIVRDNPTHPLAYYYLGALAYEDKKLEQAAEYYAKALQVNPEFDRVYFDLAGVDITLNKIPEALAVLEKARARFPDNFFVEFYTGLAQSRQKQYRDALRNFTAAEVLAGAGDTNRLNHLFYYQVGIACERTQDYAGAEKYFKKCLALAPNFAPALNYLGYMWVDRDENLDEARVLIEKAVKEEPKNAAFLDSLAWVLFKQNQPKEALEQILEAVKHSSEEDATLYDHMGDIYAHLKQPDKARESWRKSLALEPNDQVKKKLEASVATDTVRK